MAYTSHGHYIIGTRKTGTPPKRKSRCYGGHSCITCSNDIKAYWEKHGVEPVKGEGSVTITEASHHQRAKTILENYIASLLPEDSKLTKIQAYVIKLTLVGDDWKAILTSNVDDFIYEIVYLSKLKVGQITAFSKIYGATVQAGA